MNDSVHVLDKAILLCKEITVGHLYYNCECLEDVLISEVALYTKATFGSSDIVDRTL